MSFPPNDYARGRNEAQEEVRAILRAYEAAILGAKLDSIQDVMRIGYEHLQRVRVLLDTSQERLT